MITQPTVSQRLRHHCYPDAQQTDLSRKFFLLRASRMCVFSSFFSLFYCSLLWNLTCICVFYWICITISIARGYGRSYLLSLLLSLYKIYNISYFNIILLFITLWLGPPCSMQPSSMLLLFTLFPSFYFHFC
jgi:hypothetical protein